MKTTILGVVMMLSAFVPYESARATTIPGVTFTETPGTYSITGSNVDDSNVVVYGNYSNGAAFVYTNNTFTNLSMSGYMSVTPVASENGFILANAETFGLSESSLIYDKSGSLVSSAGGVTWSAAGQNGQFGGTSPITGLAVYGYIDSIGHVTQLQSVSVQGAEYQGGVFGVNGTHVAGEYSSDTKLSAFLSINGVRQTLDVGNSSLADCIDITTNVIGGSRNGLATIWTSSGYSNIPSASGPGYLSGAVTSAFGGLYTIKDSQGNLWISNGTSTLSFMSYLLGLGITGVSSTQNALFEGSGSIASLIFEDSIGNIQGPIASLTEPLIDASVAVPEPSTSLLTMSGMLLTIACMSALTRRTQRVRVNPDLRLISPAFAESSLYLYQLVRSRSPGAGN